jgi:flagellar basal body-associated protein FliL
VKPLAHAVQDERTPPRATSPNTMLVVLVVAMLVLLAAAMAVVLGAGPLLIVLLGIIAVAVAACFAALVGSGRTPSDAMRETKPVEHLGPGGPDDPR